MGSSMVFLWILGFTLLDLRKDPWEIIMKFMPSSVTGTGAAIHERST